MKIGNLTIEKDSRHYIGIRNTWCCGWKNHYFHGYFWPSLYQTVYLAVMGKTKYR